MTVIAWDGTTLAADKMALVGGGIQRKVTKINRFVDVLLAVTGHWDTACELRAWYMQGADPANFPAKAREDLATLTVFGLQGIRSYSSGPYPLVIEASQYAGGSGRDYAEAAMYLGKSAIEAVEIACHFQSGCGLGIDALRIES